MDRVKADATPTPAPTRTYGGQTADERATQRHDALLDAAFGLVAEDGWRPLRIEALCRRAGLNKRYFYEAFADLDAVVAAVTRRLADEAIAATLAQVHAGTDPSPDATVRRAVTAFIEHLTDDPRRARVLFGALPADDAADQHRAAAIREVIVAVVSEGRQLHDVPDDAFAETAASMLVGGTSQAILDWLDGRVDCSRTAFVARVVVLWQAVGDVAAGARPPTPPEV